VKLSPSGLIEHAKSTEGRKQLRYAAVSVVFVPVGQILVLTLHLATNLADPMCILLAAVILTVPNYFANKIVVWRDTNKDNLRTQILVFWVAAMLGTGFAMALALISDAATANSSKLVSSFWLFMAQLFGYGTIWVARYFFLDKWLFKATHQGEEPTEIELEELHSEFPI